MNKNHHKAFWAAATKFSCSFGVREPNPLLDDWIDDGGCVPKPVRCNAKTADRKHAIGGLVANPKEFRNAFEKPQEALIAWNRFAHSKNKVPGKTFLPVGYREIDSGELKGLVTLNRKFIHSDYDLMAVIFYKEEYTFQEYQNFLNKLLRKDMIQHPPEMLYEGSKNDQGELIKRVRAKASESIIWFGPKDKLEVSRSSMSEEPDEQH